LIIWPPPGTRAHVQPLVQAVDALRKQLTKADQRTERQLLA
jgi:hypothetical protein